jgi:hypothetical protein
LFTLRTNLKAALAVKMEPLGDAQDDDVIDLFSYITCATNFIYLQL